MTNKTIILSRELAERTLDAIEQVGYQDKFIDYTFVRTVKQELHSALDEPVPPAGGEVEVKRGILIDEGYGEIWMDWGADSCMDRNEGPYVLASDFDKHVTQLQAELTSAIADKNAFAQNAVDLRAEVGRLKQENGERYGSMLELANGVAALKSELTKARELLKDIQNSTIDTLLHSRIDTVLSHQSAPADDCAHSEANKHGCQECGEEFKSADKGHGEPVAVVMPGRIPAPVVGMVINGVDHYFKDNSLVTDNGSLVVSAEKLYRQP